MSEKPEDYITDALEVIGDICGVYFLTHNREIVYIGMSTNIRNRIKQHIKQGEKIFDGFSFIECGKRELYWRESKYINKFKPKYNKVIPSCYEKMDWTRVWQINDNLAQYPIPSFREWMRRMGYSESGLYEKDDFAEFDYFSMWWRKSNKSLSPYHCLPADVSRWFDIGMPKVGSYE